MLTLVEIIEELTGQRPVSYEEAQVDISTVVVDSRQATAGSLFVALQGEKQDGHDFISDALERGAIAVIAEERGKERVSRFGAAVQLIEASNPASLTSSPLLPVCIVVPNSLRALQQLAAFWRRRCSAKVVGVTGSVGKTVTKELIAAVLRQRFKTLKSPGNMNNEIGLPLTLLQLTPKHERAVVEMGMYAIGEIAHLARLAQPAIGVVTNVGPTHLERLGSLERIAQAKAELPQALPPDGVAVLNADDEYVRAMAGMTQARVLTYGLSEKADVRASMIQSQGLEGVRFRLHYGDQMLHVTLPLLGRHSVHTGLAAAAVGIAEDMPWHDILTGLRNISAHLRLVAVPGPNGSTILDDTYNASPVSTIAALNLLEELNGRKIAVLGDMYELGSYEKEAHRLVGGRAAAVVDHLVAVGRLGRLIGEAALAAGMSPDRVSFAEDNARAIVIVNEMLQPADVVLVKGSRGMQMEEIVKALSVRNT